MSKIIDTFGSLIATFHGFFDDIVWALFIYILIVYMITTFFNSKVINNIFISEIIDKEFQKTRKNASRNKKKSDESTMKLLLSHGYSAFASIWAFVFKCIFGLLFAYGLSTDAVANIDTTIYDINTTLSLKELFMVGDSRRTLVVVLFVLAAFVQLLIDGYIENKVVMDQSKVDLVLLVIFIALGIFVPSGFIIYYLFFAVIELFFLYFQTTMMHDSGIKRIERSMNYKKSSFDKRYEEQMRRFNNKK